MKTSIFTLLFLLPLYVLSQDSLSAHYKIYSSISQKVVTVDEIAAGMDKADVIFFGEEHSDSAGHCLEHAIFKALAARYHARVALSMEMFETDCQTVINEYLRGLIREKNFINEARAWHNYKDYRPLIELAKSGHIPVVAANAPARYVNMTNRLGLGSLQQLDAVGKSFLPPLPIDTATGAYYNKFDEIMGGHGAVAATKIYQAQNLWDATMAWNIAAFFKTHPKFKILQINGGFHSEEKLGAVAQLKK
ncbi:MAG: ChaN family lipoprotein, partial [Mucilaginibacter sp.]